MALMVQMVWVRSRWKAKWCGEAAPGGKLGSPVETKKISWKARCWGSPFRMDVGLAESCIQVSLCRFF